MPLKVLIASTTWFALPARVTLAFVELGARVSVIVPKGSPVLKVHGLEARLSYNPFDPLLALSKAILMTKPDLIIPCDDRVVEHLHGLYARRSETSAFGLCAPVIERSLGEASGFSISSKRTPLLRLAERQQILIPETELVSDPDALRRWLETYGYPAVLKVDGTWAGSGVRVVRTWDQAHQAFLELTRPPSLLTRLRFLCAHDLFPLFAQDKESRKKVTAQKFIRGRSVNAMYACREGELLDHLSVEALYSVDQLGSSTIVKTILNAEMERAGRLIIRELKMTGFCGLDFIVEADTEKLYLIELNPRITQIGHLKFTAKQSLIATLYKAFCGEETASSPSFVEETIAFFPHSLRCNPSHPLLGSPALRHDIPIEEPALVHELSRRPWNSRHLSSKVYSVLRKLVASEPVDAAQADHF